MMLINRLKGKFSLGVWCWIALSVLLIFSITAEQAQARKNIRDSFLTVYPDTVGTTIETVPSHSQHCGVCHFSFAGGGTRNPYGLRLEAVLPDFSNNKNGKRQAVQSIENEDPDNDGFSTLIEVTDTVTFSNTPTFPGLTPTNLASVADVDKTEIQAHLIPTTGGDTTTYSGH